MQARALAVAAQRMPAARALDAAHSDLEAAPAADHPWLSPFDTAALASESALILRDLERYDEALTHAERAVTLREAGRTRSLALSRISLVDIHVRRGDLDAAVSVGHDLLSTSPTLGSVRVVQQLDGLRRLLEPHRGYPPVRDYLARFDDARAPGENAPPGRHHPAVTGRHHRMRPAQMPTPADPEAWNAYLAEGNAKQARKRVAADVLLRDGSDRLLLVNPTYKPGWDLPGGMAEANEPPEEAVRRELVEELGLHVTLHGLLVVDWVAPHGPWDDQLAFIFDGGTLDQDQADRLQPRDEELSEAAFVTAAEAGFRLRERIRRRFEGALQALDAGRPLYLRDGTPVM
jgi:ADP-ribose pyrophosphatase YjhB (NUDIX family)